MASKPAPRGAVKIKGVRDSTFGRPENKGQKNAKPPALDSRTNKSAQSDWNPPNPKMSPMYGHASKSSPDTLVNAPGFRQDTKVTGSDMGNSREFYGQPGSNPSNAHTGTPRKGSGKTVGEAKKGTRPGNPALE